MGLTKATNRMTSGAPVNILDFGAVGDGVTDDTVAIQDAIDAVGATEGMLIIPEGTYKTTSQLNLPSGVSLSGQGRRNASIIKAYHTGPAILNLKGAGFCRIQDIALATDTTTYPKTGIALGRSTSASAGHHHIENVKIQGYFSEAVFYSIASEVNTIQGLYMWNLGGASTSKYGFYTSEADDLSVDSFVTSTNLVGNIHHLNIVNSSSDIDAACIYIEAGESTGSWNFYGAYLTSYKGSYIQINNATDAQIIGPYSFSACSGERLTGGDPTYGFKLTSSVACNFKGLNITGSRFDLLAGATHYTFWADPAFVLTTPNIILQPSEAFPYAEEVYTPGKIKGGLFCVSREGEQATPTLLNSWVNHYGSPWIQVGYKKTPEGIVYVTGRVTGGSGVIMTLPEHFRPSADTVFAAVGNAAVAELKVATTGDVTLLTGAGPVNLTSIIFPAGN